MFRTFLHVCAVKLVLVIVAVLAVAVAGCKDGKTNSAGATSALVRTAATSAVEVPPYLTNAQPRLPTMKLFVGDQELTTELALKPVEIYTGMMWRTNMPEGTAMLFVFGDAAPRGFYMRNCYVPLSLAYIDPEGVVQEIHDLQPHDEKPVKSESESIQFVLEVPQGWFKRHNIAVGSIIRSPAGALKNTFTFHAPQ